MVQIYKKILRAKGNGGKKKNTTTNNNWRRPAAPPPPPPPPPAPPHTITQMCSYDAHCRTSVRRSSKQGGDPL